MASFSAEGGLFSGGIIAQYRPPGVFRQIVPQWAEVLARSGVASPGDLRYRTLSDVRQNFVAEREEGRIENESADGSARHPYVVQGLAVSRGKWVSKLDSFKKEISLWVVRYVFL